MSENQPIHLHESYAKAGEHNHTGMRSHRRGLDSILNKLNDYRRERTFAHESGHTPSSIDVIPQDQEIVLFPQVAEEIK